MVWMLGLESKPHLWEASTFTNAPSPLPKLLVWNCPLHLRYHWVMLYSADRLISTKLICKTKRKRIRFPALLHPVPWTNLNSWVGQWNSSKIYVLGHHFLYQDLSMCHDWPVKSAMVSLPIRLKGNLKSISSHLLSLFWGPEQGYQPCFADVTNRG